ncbi:MAG: signal peptidase I [Clostridia bacterium]|nr:signal peptidase I [Clostridia bacterium]
MIKNEEKKTIKQRPKALKIFSYVISGLLLAAFIFVLVCFVYVIIQTTRGNQATLFGYRLYYVLTDSMEPTLNEKDMIISKSITDTNDYAKVDAQIDVGDIVTFKMILDGKVVQNTHRVVEDVYFDAEKGTYCIKTKGDKQGATIDEPVPIINLEAKMVRKASIVSKLYNFLSTTAGISTLIIIPLALVFISLIYQLVIKIKGYKETPKETEDSNDNKILTKEEKEQRIRELTEQAIKEYLENQNKDKKE